jgi:hypothetical protein
MQSGQIYRRDVNQTRSQTDVAVTQCRPPAATLPAPNTVQVNPDRATDRRGRNPDANTAPPPARSQDVIKPFEITRPGAQKGANDQSANRQSSTLAT